MTTPAIAPRPWRRCAKCGELQPIEQFPADETKKSGHKGVCTTCQPASRYTPEQVARMCTGKNRYTTRAVALRVALKRARQTTRIRVYECPVCEGFHLTSTEARA